MLILCLVCTKAHFYLYYTSTLACAYLQPAGQTRRTIVAVLGIAAVAYGYNVTQHPERLPGINMVSAMLC